MQDEIDEEFAAAFEEALIATIAAEELLAAETAYLRDNSYHTETPDLDGWIVWKYHLRGEVPLNVRRLARESLFCARHALDHATNATIRILQNENLQYGGWPLSKNKSQLHGDLKRRNIDQRLWPVFEKAGLYTEPQDDQPEISSINKVAKFAGQAKHKVAIGIDPGAVIEEFYLMPRPGYKWGQVEHCDSRWDSEKREARIVRYPSHVEVTKGGVGARLTLKTNNGEVDLAHTLRIFARKAKFVTERLAKGCRAIRDGQAQ